MRSLVRVLSCGLLAALLLTTLVLPARAERLGPGHPSPPGFSGYTTRSGHELGVARVPDGPFGICLDTGTRRWPRRAGTPTTVRHPVVGYLLSVHLDAARRDGVLATALWWVVGRLERLNAEPDRMTARMAELRRESPRLFTAVVRRATRLVDEAARYAPPTTGYRAAPPVLTTDGLTGTLAALGIRSAAGRWVPGIRVRVTLTGATFDGGRSTLTLRTGTDPLFLGWQRTGASAVAVRVRYSGIPEHRFRRYRSGARFQRVAASAGTRSLVTALTTPELSTPRISTRVNRQRATVGALLVDRVRVTGSRGVAHEGEWELLGPVRPDADLRCRAARWAGAPLAGRGTFRTRGDATVEVGRTRLRSGGCYTYRERLLPSSVSLGAPWTRAGLVEETSLVTPRQPHVPRHPQVDTGGKRRAGRAPDAGDAGAGRVVVPGAVRARLVGTSFHGRTLGAPRPRGSAGVWRGSVPLASLVGTTLLAGHVADDRGRPGAFHGLRRARPGDRVTTRDGSGTVRHWQVRTVRTFDRRRLPRSLFQQGVDRRLLLITCVGRVTLPGGGFHYRRNLVVEAVPIS
ncbi:MULTISPECIES: class F sortase [unclassified Nocardioides]|uniref:class F sortase n=1 Tax=unclassified Nocardioides TaxID=2615069 RepID=UPI000703AF42|nr:MULTISPECIES: class F sortase [unclassified Nocardioides]KRC50095.1 hypothetical protein ASE19_15880 [Nocardioides sp. Root79]KRC75562.1 hypothetical protein ASE20_21900 [Nocardioides sp. Root240]